MPKLPCPDRVFSVSFSVRSSVLIGLGLALFLILHTHAETSSAQPSSCSADSFVLGPVRLSGSVCFGGKP